MPQPTTVLPTVALIGRVNVGKSTLFNRIIGEPRSIVSPLPGTTRDVQETLVTWRGIAFTLLDTGGFDVEDDRTGIPAQVLAHSRLAAARANLVILMVDARAGLLPTDRTIAEELRKSGKPLIVAVNKSDNLAFRELINEFWKLGMGEPLALSARNGSGVGDLLDRIVQMLTRPADDQSPQEARPAPVRIAILGKPNVGKSTLLNALLGYERSIVSPHAHTTREPIDTPLFWENTPLVLIDTAGIRKKAKVTRGLESQGVSRSIQALKRSDATMLVLDMAEGINDQDKQLAHLIEESGTALVIVGNKWDLIHDAQKRECVSKEVPREKRLGLSITQTGLRRLARERGLACANRQDDAEKGNTLDTGAQYLNYIHGRFPFLTWAPVVFTSALTRAHVRPLIETALHTARARAMTLEQAALDQFIAEATQRHALPRLGPKRKRPELIGFQQNGANPPSFALLIRTRERFPESYLRFLEKELRNKYDLVGTPVQIAAKVIK